MWIGQTSGDFNGVKHCKKTSASKFHGTECCCGRGLLPADSSRFLFFLPSFKSPWATRLGSPIIMALVKTTNERGDDEALLYSSRALRKSTNQRARFPSTNQCAKKKKKKKITDYSVKRRLAPIWYITTVKEVGGQRRYTKFQWEGDEFVIDNLKTNKYYDPDRPALRINKGLAHKEEWIV